MSERNITGRERRRRKVLEKTRKEFEKNFENVEPDESRQSGGKRREVELGSGDGSDSATSRNLTYSLGSEENFTYNVDISGDFRRPEIPEDGEEKQRPVPAPRKRSREPEKPSSDTDRDVTEIDLDDLRPKSPELDPPVPKPRKKTQKLAEKKPELPIVENLAEEAKKENRKRKMLTSLVKFEKRKIPKMSAILKEFKEKKEEKVEGEDEKFEFQIESPHYVESEDPGRIYVQKKNGFHVVEKKILFQNGGDDFPNEETFRKMENSTVKTAALFQKFWTRSMSYFHGVLGGLGFCHAAVVTAIMLRHDYDAIAFVAVYSCLSLKVHYVFYALIALSIVSCFDRIDIGHMNKKHWETAWKVPSMWLILFLYLVAFVLTFYHQMTEVRFDAFPDANATEIWPGQTPSQVQVNLVQWYHAVWTRDVLVLFAWLLISLTSFDDFLHSHISNMAKYAESPQGKTFHHRTESF